MQHHLDWLWNHPAEALWIAFGALTAFVIAFSSVEKRIASYVLRTKTKVDNKIFRSVAHVVHLLAVVIKMLGFFTPRFASITRAVKVNKSIPPSASADVTPVTNPETPAAISDKPKP